MGRIVSDAKDVAAVYGGTHPYTLISYVMGFTGENFGNDVRVTFRKLNGKAPKFYEVRRLWGEGRLCWCVT